MKEESRALNLKGIIECGAFFCAYRECALAQRLGNRYISRSVDEMADGLWERIKRLEQAPYMNEEYRKLFRILFEKEFRAVSDLLEQERDEMIEQTERFFQKIGYEPELRITRE
jgi:hypothetical protein